MDYIETEGGSALKSSLLRIGAIQQPSGGDAFVALDRDGKWELAYESFGKLRILPVDGGVEALGSLYGASVSRKQALRYGVRVVETWLPGMRELAEKACDKSSDESLDSLIDQLEGMISAANEAAKVEKA